MQESLNIEPAEEGKGPSACASVALVLVCVRSHRKGRRGRCTLHQWSEEEEEEGRYDWSQHMQHSYVQFTWITSVYVIALLHHSKLN